MAKCCISRIYLLKKNWNTLGETVRLRSNEFTTEEVLGLKSFLKLLANEYSDMELLSTGIQDKTKATQAIAAAKEFRKIVRECDNAASDRDFKSIIEKYPKTVELLNTFLDSMKDVPDEL